MIPEPILKIYTWLNRLARRVNFNKRTYLSNYDILELQRAIDYLHECWYKRFNEKIISPTELDEYEDFNFIPNSIVKDMPLSEKKKFAKQLYAGRPVAHIADLFGVSRTTAWRWIRENIPS